MTSFFKKWLWCHHDDVINSKQIFLKNVGEHILAEVNTNNIISKAQRSKAQRSVQPIKAQRKIRNLILLISEAQRNFRNKLFDSVKA